MTARATRAARKPAKIVALNLISEVIGDEVPFIRPPATSKRLNHPWASLPPIRQSPSLQLIIASPPQAVWSDCTLRRNLAREGADWIVNRDYRETDQRHRVSEDELGRLATAAIASPMSGARNAGSARAYLAHGVGSAHQPFVVHTAHRLIFGKAAVAERVDVGLSSLAVDHQFGNHLADRRGQFEAVAAESHC